MVLRTERLRRRSLDASSDDELTACVRRGDQLAFGQLYERHHRAARSTARVFLRSEADADDVVADAFAGVLAAIGNGHGPRDNFRRYLLACVRNGCRVRVATVAVAPDDARLEDSDHRSPTFEDPEGYVEANIVARAFSALPARWQHTLWETAVEERSVGELGNSLQLTNNAAAALAHRAREAFALAYLAEHAGTASAAECRRVAPLLAAHVRHRLGATRDRLLTEHLAHCAECSAAAADLTDINATLRNSLPAALAATATWVATTAGTTSTVGTGGSTASALAATTTTVASGVPTTGGPLAALAGLTSVSGLLAKAAVGLVLVIPLAMSGDSPKSADAVPVASVAARDEIGVGGPAPAARPPQTTAAAAAATAPPASTVVAPTPTAPAPWAPALLEPPLRHLIPDLESALDVTVDVDLATRIDIGRLIGADVALGLGREVSASANVEFAPLGAQASAGVVVGATPSAVTTIEVDRLGLVSMAGIGADLAAGSARVTVQISLLGLLPIGIGIGIVPDATTVPGASPAAPGSLDARIPTISAPTVSAPAVSTPALSTPVIDTGAVIGNPGGLPVVQVPSVELGPVVVAAPDLDGSDGAVEVGPVALPTVVVPPIDLGLVEVPGITVPAIVTPAVVIDGCVVLNLLDPACG